MSKIYAVGLAFAMVVGFVIAAMEPQAVSVVVPKDKTEIA